jgi:hypothetical protein
MHEEVLSENQKEILPLISSFSSSFGLIGGTAIALQLGHWKPFENEIKNILNLKRDNAALIVYAPQSEGFIDKESLEKINLERNAIIVNFRGRLLNDILTSMITTTYE